MSSNATTKSLPKNAERTDDLRIRAIWRAQEMETGCHSLWQQHSTGAVNNKTVTFLFSYRCSFWDIVLKNETSDASAMGPRAVLPGTRLGELVISCRTKLDV